MWAFLFPAHHLPYSHVHRREKDEHQRHKEGIKYCSGVAEFRYFQEWVRIVPR